MALKHGKIYLPTSVYAAARERIRAVYREFGRAVTLSFSGGKDSSVLLHLALSVAEEMQVEAGQEPLLPLRVLFVDMEGQYRETIRHVTEMMDDPRIDGTWICLPINLRNAASQTEPYWSCWDIDDRDRWVRDLPVHKSVISDPAHFPFFRHRMEFEEFIPAYEQHLAETLGVDKIAVLIGVRSDESLNRYKAVSNPDKKSAWNGCTYSAATRRFGRTVVNFFPIYDWGVEDIWTYLGRGGENGKPLAYNRLYDWMYLHGTSIHDMRICQPYGDEQRQGLDQFHAIEPDTWFRIVARVPSANYGARYARQKLMGYSGGVGRPAGFATWKAYTKWLLTTVPPEIEHQYRTNFLTFLRWWKAHRKSRGYAGVFDAGVKNKETGRNIPSWERMARCILKNDLLCHSLKFGQTVKMPEKLAALKKKYAEL